MRGQVCNTLQEVCKTLLPLLRDCIPFYEWVEGSYIEPSATFGDLYVQVMAQWIARFKGGP